MSVIQWEKNILQDINSSGIFVLTIDCYVQSIDIWKTEPVLSKQKIADQDTWFPIVFSCAWEGLLGHDFSIINITQKGSIAIGLMVPFNLKFKTYSGDLVLNYCNDIRADLYRVLDKMLSHLQLTLACLVITQKYYCMPTVVGDSQFKLASRG